MCFQTWLLAILVQSSQHTQPVGTKQDAALFDMLCNAFNWWIVTTLGHHYEVPLEIWFNGHARENTSPQEGTRYVYILTCAQTAFLAHCHLVWSVERLQSFNCGSLIYFCLRNLCDPLFCVYLFCSSWVLHGSDKGTGGCGASPRTAVLCSNLPWRVPVLSGFWLLFCAVFPVCCWHNRMRLCLWRPWQGTSATRSLLSCLLAAEGREQEGMENITRGFLWLYRACATYLPKLS